MAIESDELPVAGTSLAVGDSSAQPANLGSHLFEQGSLLGELVAERYRVLELLGTGGMGCVYRAEHVHMRKSVALKVLHRELTHLPDIVSRFEREAIAAARIAHQNVAGATDFGRLPDGACYLVLEYVQGKSLRFTLQQSAPLGSLRALNIARQIALALGAAHDASVVHRDLKPENVMLVEAGSDTDFVKVLDFGIAKIQMPEQESQTALTRMGTIFGTPEYMSPEQALGQTADLRTDLYSLGIILYEMLTARTPFADKELVAVLTKQMTELPPPMPSEIDPSVVAIVMSLLAKRPSERPQTAHELVARLDSAIAHLEPIDDSVAAASSSATAASVHLVPTDRAAHSSLASISDGAVLPKQSIPPWLRRSIRIGRRKVPTVLVLLVAFGTFSVTLLVIMVVSLSHPSSSNTPAHSASNSSNGLKAPTLLARLVAPAPDPLIKRARLGDTAALKELEQRPPASLDAEHWSAMARGRARNREWAAMLEAYGNALQKAPQLASDGELVSDVRAATLETATSGAAMRFAAEKLGTRGADVVYDAWSNAAAGRGGQVETKTAKKLLESATLRQHASKPLMVALELLDARGCNDYKKALPKVIREGDERSVRTLRRLSHDRGCGLFGLGDCYSCLRSSNSLSQAIEAAKGRPGPTF